MRRALHILLIPSLFFAIACKKENELDKLRYKAVEFFLTGDNVLSWFLPRAVVPLKKLHPVFPDSDSDRSIAVPYHMKNHNLRAGVTIALGREKGPSYGKRPE